MKDLGETMSEDMQKLVRANGDEVAINEPPCVLWKSDHDNCEGCQYELGCGKTVRMLLLMMMPMTYTPKNFADHQAMNNRIQELSDMILKAKTFEELLTVPHM